LTSNNLLLNIRGKFDSPEILKGENAEKKSDVFSLGMVMLYVVNNGRGIFEKVFVKEIVMNIYT
jgi:serine/threonine protein kinase